ncbi:MAG: serine hydrolase, partial [Legionella sp.]|nr:serine hydrolase [Legionella sp.]
MALVGLGLLATAERAVAQTPTATPVTPVRPVAPAPPAPSVAPAAPATPSMAALQTELQRLINGTKAGGEYAVAVTDLQTGETISVNGNRPHLAACSVNLFVLMQAMLDLQSGRVREDQVGTLMAQTIYASNAVTAHSLYGVLGDGDVLRGVRRVIALINRLGMKDTILDHPPGFPESVGINPNNWTTALDMNRGLKAIWDGPILDTRWRDDFLARLVLVKPGLNYLTAVVPGVVSHKNGFFQASDGTYVDNDSAIVRFTHEGKEYAYAISILAQWVPQ